MTKNICMLEPCEKLEDSLQYHDELLGKGLSSDEHLKVHNAIGVADCEETAAKCGQCKAAFKEKFCKELVDKYADIVGTKNRFNEDYWRGEETYRKTSAEAYFYQSFKILRGAKSVFINDYIKKIWYLLGQRAPTMNACEKLLRSAYGRPFYKLITGRSTQRVIV